MTDSKEKKNQWHYHVAVLQKGGDDVESSILDANINYGPGCCHFIPAYRGKSDINPEEIAEYLKLVSSGEKANTDPKFTHTNPLNIKYQDKVVPGTYDDGPENELVRKLVDEIMLAAANWSGQRIFPVSLPWTIVHGEQHQTFPHAHSPEKVEKDTGYWAVVYWAQVPPNSGLLELYPNGFTNMTGDDTNYVIPKAGDYFIFPANLLHGVRQNGSEELRISMSFNMESKPMSTLLDEVETL